MLKIKNMNIKDKAKQFVEVIKIHLQNEHLTDDFSYYSFLLSLLPIPGVQQAGQAVDRIFANKSLKNRLDNIWNEINIANNRISTIEDEFLRFQEIAGTIKYNRNLDDQINEVTQTIISELQEQTEWVLETENWSYQSILNSIVEADFAQIIARNNSVNTIENTEIKAKKTHLHASNNSQNFVDKTKFSSNEGGVEMNGISTQGNVIVEGSGIGFGEGSALIFGGNPNLVSGNCPSCQTMLQVDKRQLNGYSQIQCDNCKRTMPFTVS
jgi:hypothetical protein